MRDDADAEHELAEVTREHGPWVAYNLQIAPEVYTIGKGKVGSGEKRIQQILRAISDHLGDRDISDANVLDLGSHEGGFSIELALKGARVTSIEGRARHVAKARFVQDCRDLKNLTVLHSDVRDVAQLDDTYDIVLCLGILYHLMPQDALDLLREISEKCTGFAIVETQISLRPREKYVAPNGTYHGRWYDEHHVNPGASIDNESSFWFTKSSLINALVDAGFTSVTELMSPAIPELAQYRDHVTLIAFKGRPLEVESIPDVMALPRARWRRPERLPRRAHPQQSLFARVQESINRRRGQGIAASVWRREDLGSDNTRR